MNKWKFKLLKKIQEKGRMLFSGKPDLDSINFLSQENSVTAVFTKINQKNLVKHSLREKNLAVLFVKSFNEIEKEFDFSVLFLEEYSGKKESQTLIENAATKTKLNGKIYCICKTSRGGKLLKEKMNEIFGNSETLSIKGGVRLIVSEKKKEVKVKEKEEEFFDFEFRKNKFVFASASGVFSRKKVDEGTKLLLENLTEIKGRKILDFGCGIGVIGIVVAKENPESEILMIDSDAKAVNLTEKNIELNKITNAKILVSDGLKQIQEKFSLIVSNPPTHEKRDFLEEFVVKAKKSLGKKGRLVLVLNKKVFLEKELKESFGNYKILAEGKSHKIIEAVKE